MACALQLVYLALGLTLLILMLILPDLQDGRTVSVLEAPVYWGATSGSLHIRLWKGQPTFQKQRWKKFVLLICYLYRRLWWLHVLLACTLSRWKIWSMILGSHVFLVLSFIMMCVVFTNWFTNTAGRYLSVGIHHVVCTHIVERVHVS